MGRKTAVLLGLLAVCLLAGLLLKTILGKEEKTEYREEIFAMDTVMSFSAYGKHAEKAVVETVRRMSELEALYSTEKAGSDVARLNAAGSAEVSPEVLTLVDVSKEVWEATGGAFDCTVYPLMRLWGFPEKEYRVPAEAEIAEALALVDASRIRTEGSTVTLGEGQAVDFGGIGKGFASAEAMRVFRECGVKSGLVSLGGNVQVLGTKPDGSDWRIGIRDPKSGGSKLVLSVKDCCVITSGGYERFFEADGRTYIHILDPETGRPVENELASVSVISGDAARADALSTALFVMGYEKGSAWWQEHAGECQIVWIFEDGNVALTEGLSERYEMKGTGEVQVLGRP
ncbi:MAG: FAD:protein FMN transferase [Lachnospiraceae bacterium]|nr:FAD:protein FMN transferase [Lachnospiraceae bacterium]